MSKTTLEQRVLADPRLSIYACGRTDIESGGIDRRVLAVMEYLVEPATASRSPRCTAATAS